MFQIELAQSSVSDQDEVSTLQQQNDNLRAVIKEMRTQMEELGHDIPDVNLQPQRGDKITEGQWSPRLQILVLVQADLF